MTADDLKAYRQLTGLSQTDMGARLGLSMRQYQDLERGEAEIRPIHLIALEFASLQLALAAKDINLARPRIRRDALDFAAMVRGD